MTRDGSAACFWCCWVQQVDLVMTWWDDLETRWHSHLLCNALDQCQDDICIVVPTFDWLFPLTLSRVSPCLFLMRHWHWLITGRWSGHVMSRLRARNCCSWTQVSWSWDNTADTPAERLKLPGAETSKQWLILFEWIENRKQPLSANGADEWWWSWPRKCLPWTVPTLMSFLIQDH